MVKEPTTEEKRHNENSSLNNAGLPEKLSLLRQKLNQKAKEEQKFKFYALYDKIYRKDVLRSAYNRVRAKKGSAGVDGITFKIIEEEGVDIFLSKIEEELKQKRYNPTPVKRVYIPKSNGEKRPLGIPAIRDRVVQMAVLLIIEPIFEADFKECSYGFRPGKNAHQALEEIRNHIQMGFREIYDADLKGYFDSIPHDKLMLCVEQRIADRLVLSLIRKWLNAPIVEPPEKKGGRPTVKRSKKGTPQGGVISPLLANLYLHYFDKIFHGQNGAAVWANAKLVRYADDFVVLARYQSSRIHEFIESFIEGRMGLTINRDKTKVINLNNKSATLDFLGFSFRYDRDLSGRDKKYLNVFPSKKSIARERNRLREMTDKSLCFVPIPSLIEDINRHLSGWKNYYDFGYPRKAFREINSFARLRLTKHLKRRSQRSFQPPEGQSFYKQFDKFKLIYL